MKPQIRRKSLGNGPADKKSARSKIRKQAPPPAAVGQAQKPDGQIQPDSRARKARTPNHFPIVGIGASAGGLEAFTQLLKHLPPDTGLGFVLVQHLDPEHKSNLTELLSRATSMPVHEISNNLRVAPNHVYVIPPNTNLGIAQGVLKLRPRQPKRMPARSIDYFFKSLAEDQREKAIGVILSGTASDGTLGLEDIKAEGGITFAQDASARYDSMPRSAEAAGCVDFVLSPENMTKELARIARHPYVAGGVLRPELERDADQRQGAQAPLASGGRGMPDTGSTQARSEAKVAPEEAGESGFKKILLLLRNHSGVDFSLYKSTTIRRRILRRMVLNKQTTLEDYAAFLRGNVRELDALYSDVLISVTSFFRNPEAFEILKRKVFPRLLRQRNGDPLRVWVLGCSTGQEAYSIAMTFMESAENTPNAPRLQVFATDLNDALLEKARHGLYAKSLAQDVSPERLRRFFVEEEGGYRISKSLREMVVFARQNLISDPPFSRMDLISCRNLLIYLEPDLQKNAIPTFHYALKPEGFLFLGASESLSGFTDLFEPVDKKHKIYLRKEGQNPAFHLPAKKQRGGRHGPTPRLPLGHAAGQPTEMMRTELNAQREADRIMVNQFAPPGVLINAGLQILQFRGATGAYLEPPAGKATLDVLKMAREGLMLPLRAAINRARRENKPVRRENVRMQQNGVTRLLNLEVIPLKNLRERCFLILFEDSEKAGRAGPGVQSLEKPAGLIEPRRPVGKWEESRRIASLESELSETRDYLQSIQEQHEASSEELQASNEEVQSANEELQSINEELETSKEELESTNEELTTVNEEMANRNTELNRVNADLKNVHASVNLPILVLGRDLTLRRFTAPAEKIFNLLATDVGRPMSNIRHNLVFPDYSDGHGVKTHASRAPFPLEDVAREVIDTVSVREHEVQDRDGRWYLLRARPYLTMDNVMDGAVLVLVDITDLKRTERKTQAANEYTNAILRTAPDPLVVLRADLRVNTANESFYQTFRTTPDQTEGRLIYDLGNGQWNLPRLREALEEILPRNKFLKDFEITHDFPQIGRRTMLFSARQLDQQNGLPPMILLSIKDTTDRQRAYAAAALLASIVDSSDDAIIGKDLNGVIISWNRGAERLYGYTAKEAIGQSVTMVMPPDRKQEEVEILARLRRGEQVRHFETLGLRKNGSLVEISQTSSPIKDAAGQVVGGSRIARDISERRDVEQELAEKARLLDLTNDAIAVRGADDRISVWNKGAEKLYGWSASEAIGKKLHPLLQTQFPKPLQEIIAQLKGEGSFEGDVVQIAQDGRQIHSLCRWVLDPESGSILTSYTDMTERRRAEEALRKSEAWQRLLLESVKDFAIFSIDLEGRITDWNIGAEQIFGYAREEIIGQQVSVLFTPEDRVANIPEKEMRTAENEGRTVYESWRLHKNGRRFYVTGVVRPLRDTAGNLIGFLKISHDITNRKQMEEALQQAKTALGNEAGHLERLVAERTGELSAMNKQLEAFIYSIAHDLRAPLRAMQGFATMLLEEAGSTLNETGRGYAALISKSAEFMDALLRDLLTFSRISQQQVELAPINLATVVESVLSRLERDIQEKDARVENLGPWPAVLAHEPTLSQVLFNLVCNALKFVAPGTPPLVRLRTEEQSEFVRVWVEDNGIGIAPDYQEQIFRLFNRLHGELYEGTGIGLAIVQKGVERMGGRVGVESAQGQGSRFWFELRKA